MDKDNICAKYEKVASGTRLNTNRYPIPDEHDDKNDGGGWSLCRYPGIGGLVPMKFEALCLYSSISYVRKLDLSRWSQIKYCLQ